MIELAALSLVLGIAILIAVRGPGTSVSGPTTPPSRRRIQ